MSVEPGFGGQSFIPSTLNKISEIDSKKELSYEQHKFMIKFGFLTQIIDDICDLQNDINSNCNTYYVRMVQKYNKYMDKYTTINKIIDVRDII